MSYFEFETQKFKTVHSVSLIKSVIHETQYDFVNILEFITVPVNMKTYVTSKNVSTRLQIPSWILVHTFYQFRNY
jgi:hypothetical protein